MVGFIILVGGIMQAQPLEQENFAFRLVEKLCWALALFGAAVLIILALITVVSVLGRYIFNTPISGDFEMVEIGCAVAVACFLPYCQLRQGNVIVDLFTLKAPQGVKNILDAIGCLLLTIMAGLMTWRVGLSGMDLHRYNDQTMILQFNTWKAFIIIVPCLGLLTLAGLITTWRALNGTHGTDPHLVSED